MRLNLGCGDKKVEGYCNVDICGNADMVCDLNQFPWPFADESADVILAEHFLEHVENYEKTIFEIHRVLKPEGILHFKVPHFKSPFYPWHLHHYQFSTVTCKLLCEKLPYQFQGEKMFEFVSIRLNFHYVRPLVQKVLSFLANIRPSLWEYFSFPIDEVECKVKKYTE